MASRREVTAAVAVRYQGSARKEKESILNEFTQVTGFHRKHAIRVLNREARSPGTEPIGLRRARIYDQAVQQALIVVWEAADRICAKRLKQIMPVLVGSMERYGHLQLNPEVRQRLLKMSAATMDRLLKAIRQVSETGRRRSTIRSVLRNSITVRTFSDWNDPAPGFFEMDFVAHCGKSVAGSHVHSLVLTDIASGWTEAAAMVMREQSLVTETVHGIRARLPFAMLGLDVDNDSAFINETMLNYCRKHQLELTRSRAYRKNDQAWIEQKNGAVIRKMVGYGRLEGYGAAAVLARLHDVVRLYVNYFQPCFKLKSKVREGAKVVKALVQIASSGTVGCGELRPRVSELNSMAALFRGRHFDGEVIILCVRWYLRYKLSFRDLVEMMAERGLTLAHTTILRWVRWYTPEFVKRWNQFARTTGRSWRVDETYIKVRGRWVYLYRAVDKAGQTIDFRLSATRDVAAAKAFFKKAMRHQGRPPHTITLDGYAASHRAVREMQEDGLLPMRTKLRSSKYLNNLIEQDHRGIKFRTRPMLGFKNFGSAATTIAGVELLRRIHKGQFALGRLHLKAEAVPAIWNAVLAA